VDLTQGIQAQKAGNHCVPLWFEATGGDLWVPLSFDAEGSSGAETQTSEKSIGTKRLANSDSIASASSGRDSRKPCAR
jgi:hypothetical protein